MKALFEWVPWFKELGTRIAGGGEQYLVEKAKLIPWRPDRKNEPILRFGDSCIDPFSFFYTLASKSATEANRRRLYPDISRVFSMPEMPNLDFDEGFYFPTPPAINTLFHSGQENNPQLLWTLFNSAVSGYSSVNPRNFEETLRLTNVATKKLTQALFLINPEQFLPIDDQTKTLGLFDTVPSFIKWKEYGRRIKEIKDAFPECHLYEINLFSYLYSTEQLSVDVNRCFQVSTNVYNDEVSHWEEFRENNCVYTGGPGHEMKYPLSEPRRGDVVLVRFGLRRGHAIGVVYKNDYGSEYSKEDQLHVLWLNKATVALPRKTAVIGFSSARGTADIFRQTEEYTKTFELLARLQRNRSRGGSTGNDQKTTTEVTVPFNQILCGPPGTGKTWSTTALSLKIIGEDTGNDKENRDKFRDLQFKDGNCRGQIAMVTFHQNFAYEDFVEGIRPILGQENHLGYELRDGIFKRIVDAAVERPEERFVLIIDEINRGNIPKIFGELITLIEESRRISQDDETYVTLPYSGKVFGIPNNLYILGTMNTADRSIQLLDTALRRRFVFIEMMPDPEHGGICQDIEGIDCTRLLTTVNERITVLLDQEHQIGHTYLLGVETIDELSDTMRNQIIPLLKEYFFDDWKKIRAVLGRNAFIRARKVKHMNVGSDAFHESHKIYSVLLDNHPAWYDPAQYRKIYVADTDEESIS